MVYTIKVLIEMLETLEETMLNSSQRRLSMDSWFTGDQDSKCGYAACVMGEQALKENYEMFPFKGRVDCMADLLSYARRISLNLDYACIDVLGGGNLSISIHAGDPEERYQQAFFSGLFKRSELENIPHITRDKPTPGQAAKYIHMCIDKIKNLKEV